MVQFANLDRQYGWPEGIIASLIQQESGGRANAVSHAGARGFAQFMPGTRQHMIDRYGLDPWSQDINVAARCAALYLNEQYERYDGNIEKALAAYNAGPGNVDRAVRNGGNNWLAQLRQETRNYVPQIMGRLGTNQQFLEAASSYNNAGSHTPEEEAYEAERRRGRLGALGIEQITDPQTGESRSVDNLGIGELLGLAIFAIFAEAANRAPNVQPDASPRNVPGPDANRDAAPQNGTNITPAAAEAVRNAGITPQNLGGEEAGNVPPSAPAGTPARATPAPQRTPVPQP